MACSRSVDSRLLRTALFALGALALQAGCGGSGKPAAPGAAQVTFNPASHDFGMVQVGATSAAQEFTIKSTSNGTLTVTRVDIVGNDKLHFNVTHNCTATLARAAECKATVTFTPGAEGMKSALLTFTSGANIKTAAVTGIGLKSPVLTISPATGPFGRAAVGQETAAQLFTITNEGGQDSDIPMVVSHMDFPIKANGCTAKLGPKAKCEIRVAFAPTMEGDRVGDLEVTVTGSTVKARLTGVGDARPAILAEPTSLNFGKVVVGRKSASRMVTLQNPGATPITNLKIMPSNAAFSVEGGSCGSGNIAANASCTIQVAFTPAARGPLSSELTLTLNAGLTSGIAVQGEGILAALVQPGAASLPFGSVTVGTVSGSLPVTLTNVGEEDVAGLAVTLGGANAADFEIMSNGGCMPVLRAGLQGNSCTVLVKFKPTAERASAATLSFTANPGGSGSVALTGTGVRSSLAIEPLTADFLTGTVGQASAAKTFTIRNTGSASSGNLRLTVTTDFQLVGSTDACSNVPLGPGQSCTVDVEFNPLSAGVKAGNLTATADPGGSISAILQGTAISVGQLAIRPATAPFGSVSIGMSSSEVVFTVENTGGSETGVVSVSSDSAQYNVAPVGATGCLNKTLKPNETCTVGVTFSPTAVGDLRAVLTATATPGGSTTATLTGAGIAPAPITFQNGLGMNISIHDFGPGDTVVGMQGAPVTVFIKNTGIASTGILTTTVAGDHPTDFAIVPGTNMCMASLPAGSTCSMQIAFKPTAAGDRSASITVSAATGGMAVLLVKGPAGGLIQIWHDDGTPTGRRVSSFDFGELSAGSSKTEIFRVKTPVAVGTFTINPIDTPAPPSFVRSVMTPDTCTGAALAAGGECTIAIDFQPQLPLGAKAGTLSITASTGATASLAMTGTSGGPLRFSPTPHNFGALATGFSRTQVFTLRNTNTSQPVEGLSVAISGSSDLTIAQNTCPVTLPKDDDCEVTVRFVGGTPGSKMATLTANGTYQAQGATQMTMASATITGLVASSASLTLTPSTVEFGSLAVGASPGVTRTVTVTNDAAAIMSGGVVVPGSGGGAPALPAQWSLSRNDCLLADNITPRPLGPGQSCTFDLVFVPTSTGLRSGNTTVSASPGGVAALTLNGTGLSTLIIEPAVQSLDGAGANVIRTGADTAANPAYELRVTNRGSSAIAGLAVTLEGSTVVGSDPGDTDYFGIVAGATTCTANLGPGATCVVSVSMDTRGGVPASPSPGLKYARLQAIDTGNPMTSVASSELSGTLYRDAQLSLNDTSSRTFGGVPAGRSSVRHFVQVRNLGGLTSGALQVTGTNGMALTNGFRAVLAQGTNPLTGNTACTSGILLASNDSCDLEIDFSPAAGATPGAVTEEVWVWLNGAGAGPNGTPFTAPLKIAVSGTVLPAASIYLTDTPTDFGGALAGGAVATGRELTLVNASGALVTIDSTTVTGTGYGAPTATTCAATLAAAASCTITLPAFAPPALTAEGRANGVLEVRATPAGGTQQVALAALTGRVLRPAALAIQPPVEGAVWGDALVNTEYKRIFRVRNTGEVAVTGPIAVTATVGQFAIPMAEDTCASNTSLAPNGTCTVAVVFSAAVPGAVAGSLNATNAGATAAPAQAVSANAVLAALYEIVSGAPGAIVDFGSQPVLSETHVDVRIKNRTGGQTIREVTFGLNDSVNFRIDTNPAVAQPCFVQTANGLDADEECTVRVFFRPRSLPAAPGPDNVQGALTLGGASAVQTIALKGTAVSALTIPVQGGGTGAFGTVTVNTTSASKVLRVTNAAGVPATGEVTVSLGGANAGDYRIASNGCLGLTTLAASAFCDVEVVFEPKSAGPKEARITVTASPTDGATIDLSGTGG